MIRWIVALALPLALAACSAPPIATPDALTAPTPGLPAEDAVDLTVYFRTGEGASAYLTPVTRRVPMVGNLPLRALELLVEGPRADDGADLSPVLPATTVIRGLEVTDGLATVDLSEQVITDAGNLDDTPAHELLALAAIADTLTEFPEIDRVRVTVNGRSSGQVAGVDVAAFWGSWGLPEALVRDESLIGGPVEGEGIPGVDRFQEASQATGSRDAGLVQITSVRTRDRTGYVRLVVEVAAADDPDTSAATPPCRARLVNGEVVLEISGVADYTADLAPGQQLGLADPQFESVRVEPADLPGLLRIVVVPVAGEATFWLHALSSPSRVVLDLKKTPEVRSDGS